MQHMWNLLCSTVLDHADDVLAESSLDDDVPEDGDGPIHRTGTCNGRGGPDDVQGREEGKDVQQPNGVKDMVDGTDGARATGSVRA